MEKCSLAAADMDWFEEWRNAVFAAICEFSGACRRCLGGVGGCHPVGLGVSTGADAAGNGACSRRSLDAVSGADPGDAACEWRLSGSGGPVVVAAASLCLLPAHRARPVGDRLQAAPGCGPVLRLSGGCVLQ